MSVVVVAVACAPLLIWIFLMVGRGMFWLARERDDGPQPADPAVWPAVAVVVPGRNANWGPVPVP